MMMNLLKKILYGILVPAGVFLAVSCATGSAAKNNTATDTANDGIAVNAVIGDIIGKDWILDEVRTGQTAVKITKTGTTAVYTIKFDAERVNGVGAPNRYFGPYTAGNDGTLTFGMIAGTMMAPLFEREDLREHDYFVYLEKATRWQLRNGKLELHTRNEGNTAVVLVYTE